MKRLLLILVACASTGLTWSQCQTDVTANDTTICVGDTVTMTASGPASPLTTTFAGGNNHRGNMFDIVAINTVTIESFDGHPMGNTDYEIYYKVGTYVGSETNAGAWTLVGSATNVIAQPMGTPTPIPINVGVTIPAGQTYAFYVTSTNIAVSQNYTDGTGVGNVFASDANIQFLEGAGMEYPFANGGSFFTPRVWNGNINYSMGTTFSWSTGETTASITATPTTQTTYYVDITANGCPTTTDSVTIYMNPQPIVDLGADTSVCPSSFILLDAGNVGSTYSWNNGVLTTQTALANPGITYDVMVTNPEGCTSVDTIVVGVAPVPTVDLGLDTTICEGTTITLDAANAGSTYDWNTTEITQTIDVGAGNYSVIVTNPEGCSEMDDIVISENPAPVVDLGGDTTFCVNQSATLDAGAGHAGYLWSTTATTQTVVADGTTLGIGTHTFTVEVTDSLGCTSTDDVIVNVDGCVGLIPVTLQHMEVYPNPTSDVINIELDQLTSESVLNVYSAEGTLVISEKMTAQSQSLDFSKLANGSYILELTTESYKEVIKLIKQ